jgi:hypothetical protein
MANPPTAKAKAVNQKAKWKAPADKHSPNSPRSANPADKARDKGNKGNKDNKGANPDNQAPNKVRGSSSVRHLVANKAKAKVSRKASNKVSPVKVSPNRRVRVKRVSKEPLNLPNSPHSANPANPDNRGHRAHHPKANHRLPRPRVRPLPHRLRPAHPLRVPANPVSPASPPNRAAAPI